MSTPELDPDLELVRSFDGTFIAARRWGSGERLPLLVSNAVGANLAVWRRALVDVVRDRPVVTWDQRGLYESGEPATNRLDPAAHAQDALAVLDQLGFERVALVSWSTGGRIAFELCRTAAERITALVVVCGGYGWPLWRLVRNLEPVALLPPVAGALKHLSTFIEGPFHALAARPELAGLIRQSGMIAGTADSPALVDLLRGMASCDLRALLANFEAVAGDGSIELVADIGVPTLLIAGGQDQFTSRAMTEEMSRALPGARLETYDEATHYLPIEFPARLSDDLRAFIAEVDPVTP